MHDENNMYILLLLIVVILVPGILIYDTINDAYSTEEICIVTVKGFEKDSNCINGSILLNDYKKMGIWCGLESILKKEHTYKLKVTNKFFNDCFVNEILEEIKDDRLKEI